ncbi:hypothetical protein TRVA0_051S00804 [Trichomonascus vanleenenianus]|uniref:Mak10p n=1 Tax=Trichomonascus vanleenenianus TaxID=2268995 RepID=UPI003ECA7251
MSDLTLYGHESYEDITIQFQQEAKKLKVGDLAKDDFFTLFSGVHALEIGNDKMDTGQTYRPKHEELAGLPRVESREDLIELLDEVLAREMAWHTGSILMQNVISCLYIEDMLDEIKLLAVQNDLTVLDVEVRTWFGVLRAYILATVKAVDLCAKIIKNATAIYPEEDIVVDTCGYSFLESVPMDQLVHVVKSALQFVKEQGNDLEIKRRLELRIRFLHILNEKIPREVSGHFANAKKLISSISPFTGEKRFEAAFSTGVQARVSNPSPLRELKSVEKPYEHLLQIIEGIEALIPVMSIQKSNDLLAFFLTFSSKRPRTLPIVRAMLQGVLTKTKLLSQPLKSWVLKDLKEISCGAYDHVLESNNDAIVRNLDAFLESATLCYADLLTVMCQNRPRQRQNLAHCIISFDSLQVAAEELEELFKSCVPRELMRTADGGVSDAMPIASWVYLRKLNIMIWVVLLGFELDIYKLWEYSRMYYYADYLFTALNEHLDRVQTYLTQKRMGKPAQRAAVESALGYLNALQLESTALRHLCLANMYLTHAYDLKGYITSPESSSTTTTPELLYKLRMKPFSSVGVPELPSFENFTSYKQALDDPAQLADLAKTAANNCKSLIDNLGPLAKGNSDLDLLKRSAVGVFVSSSTLTKPPSDAEVVVQRDGYHGFFPVTILKTKEG